MQYNKLYQTDQKNKNPNTEIYLRRLETFFLKKKN